jgi:hypothetical protein
MASWYLFSTVLIRLKQFLVINSAGYLARFNFEALIGSYSGLYDQEAINKNAAIKTLDLFDKKCYHNNFSEQKH